MSIDIMSDSQLYILLLIYINMENWMICDGNDIIYKVMSFLFLNLINWFKHKNNVFHTTTNRKREVFLRFNEILYSAVRNKKGNAIYL